MLLTCSITGVQFRAELIPMGQEALDNAVHPYARMSIATARAALNRLLHFNKILCTAGETFSLLAQLRLSSSAVLRHVDALTTFYEADTIELPRVASLDADTPILQEQVVHSVRAEAAASLLILDRYSPAGMPKVATLTLGAVNTLLNACAETLREEVFTASLMTQMGIDTEVEYALRTTLAIQPGVMRTFLKQLVHNIDDELCMILFHLYYLRRHNLSFHTAQAEMAGKEYLMNSVQELALFSPTLSQYDMVRTLADIVPYAKVDMLMKGAIVTAAKEFLSFYSKHIDRQLEKLNNASLNIKQSAKSNGGAKSIFFRPGGK